MRGLLTSDVRHTNFLALNARLLLQPNAALTNVRRGLSPLTTYHGPPVYSFFSLMNHTTPSTADSNPELIVSVCGVM